MTDSTLNQFLARGTQAQRLAFTPTPPTPASGPSPGYRWFETDTGDGYDWNGTGWVRNRDASLWKNPVRAGTTGALAANTYNNGTSGVGATLTANANGALAAQDGVTLVAGDRLLVKNEATGANNGIYTVTQVGSAGTPYILTRATDADTSAELVNASFKISEGTTLADLEYQCTNNASITVGTTALVFAAAGGGSSFTAASTTEVLTGTDTTKGVTPDALAALWEQGTDVASAGTISLGEGGYFNITGTTTITDIDFATDKAGRPAWVKFAGALTLTHNASTLILPTGANITTAAGDTACFISEGTDVVRCVAYSRASGAALASGSARIFAKNAAAPSGSTSTAAFASKGQVFVALENVTISRIYFKFTPVNTGTYICGIYQIGADLVIDSATDTASRTGLGTTNGWFAFDFASPVNVSAGDRFYMALTRTDSTTTYILPVNSSASNGNFVGLPLTMDANTFRIADVGPAAADTVLDAGSTASLEMGVIGWIT